MAAANANPISVIDDITTGVLKLNSLTSIALFYWFRIDQVYLNLQR